jgi:hypothetical protein
MSVKEEDHDLFQGDYQKVRKKMNLLIKKIISLLFWYGFGVFALVFTNEYIMSIYPELGTFFGWVDATRF